MSRIPWTTLVLALVASFAAVAPALAQRGRLGGAMRNAIGQGGNSSGSKLGGIVSGIQSGQSGHSYDSSHSSSHGPAPSINLPALGAGIAQGLSGAAQNRSGGQGGILRRGSSSENYSQNYTPNSHGYSQGYQPGYTGGSYHPQGYLAPATGITNLPYTQPSYHAAPLAAQSQPPANVVPPANIAPPAQLPLLATDPHPNELKLTGRPLTADEMRRAREFFKKRMDELTRTSLSSLPAIECDRDKLIELFVARSITAEIQIRILDAIRTGDFDAAQALWLANCPGVEPPFRRSRLRLRLSEFCSKWEAGGCVPSDALLLERELVALGLDENACCGAPSLLEDIQQCLLVSQVVARANLGQQGQSMAVPPGEIDIVYHPAMPEHDSIVLDDHTVMLGTGGIGTLHLQQGNVAQAQGYPLLAGPGVQASDARLTTEGILIENPTASPVQFTIDKQLFSLAPAGSQLFTGDSRKIAFNTGVRGQVLTYALTKGTFRFDTPERKWGLSRVKAFTATIDNRNGSTPFRYIVQGEHQEVAPQKVANHTSPYPLIIRFDRGNGATIKQVASTAKEAMFIVGINPRDNLWDLYDNAAPAASAQPPANVAHPATATNRPAF